DGAGTFHGVLHLHAAGPDGGGEPAARLGLARRRRPGPGRRIVPAGTAADRDAEAAGPRRAVVDRRGNGGTAAGGAVAAGSGRHGGGPGAAAGGARRGTTTGT